MSLYRFDASEKQDRQSVANPSFVSRPAGDEAQRLRGTVAAHVTDLLGEEDPAFVQDLIVAFCGSAHELVAQVRGSQDLGAVGKVAHQLKGSAANVGLTEIETAWYRVEAGAREGDSAVLGLALATAAEMTERAATLLGNGS